MALANFIKVNYNPNITPEFLIGVGKEKFPDCESGYLKYGALDQKLGAYIRKNKFVQANIFLTHKEKQGETKIEIRIGVDATLHFFLSSIAAIISLAKRGDFACGFSGTQASSPAAFLVRRRPRPRLLWYAGVPARGFSGTQASPPAAFLVRRRPRPRQ